MQDTTEREHVVRIVDRLRRDHPDVPSSPSAGPVYPRADQTSVAVRSRLRPSPLGTRACTSPPRRIAEVCSRHRNELDSASGNDDILTWGTVNQLVCAMAFAGTAFGCRRFDFAPLSGDASDRDGGGDASDAPATSCTVTPALAQSFANGNGQTGGPVTWFVGGDLVLVAFNQAGSSIKTAGPGYTMVSMGDGSKYEWKLAGAAGTEMPTAHTAMANQTIPTYWAAAFKCR
jgi:hypothetical protein